MDRSARCKSGQPRCPADTTAAAIRIAPGRSRGLSSVLTRANKRLRAGLRDAAAGGVRHVIDGSEGWTMTSLSFNKLVTDSRTAVPVFVLLAAGVLSTVVLLGLPVFVGGIVGEFGWGDVERGWLASADMAGSAFASLLVMRRIARFDWRRASRFALAVVAAGNLASPLASDLWTLVAIRFVTGLGGGVVLSIVFTGLCHSRNPERYFGLYVLAQLALQALLLAALPSVIAASGMTRVYFLFAATAAASFALVLHFPRGLAETSVGAPGAPPAPMGVASRAGAVTALVAQAIYFLSVAALWGYYEGIGSSFALGMTEIGRALAISALAGIGGALAVVVLGARMPRNAALIGGTAISIAAAWLLLDGDGYARFALSACLFNFAWNYTFPYQMGLLSRFDRHGTIAVTSLLVQLSGLAGGPAIAALFLSGAAYDAMLAAGIAGYGLSLALFLWSTRR